MNLSHRIHRALTRHLNPKATQLRLVSGASTSKRPSHAPQPTATMASPEPEPMRLPPGFLSGPAPHLAKSHVDWSLIPEYHDSWAVVLDGVLTEEECETLVAAAEGTTNGEWERAMVNIGMGMQMVLTDTRNCGRIIVDDRDLAAKLWARVAGAVPEIHRLENWAGVTGNGPAKRKEAWKVTRLNERMRFLKYVGGEYFKGTISAATKQGKPQMC